MPVLQQIHIHGLSPLIFAFEGQANKSRETHVFPGEGETEIFLDLVHDARENGFPPQFHNHHLLTDEEIEIHGIKKGKSFPMKCFLWVIDNETIKIIWEMTPNIKRKIMVPDKPFVCHTNITGTNGQAYIGGEMYFCRNENIYVNFSSGRFGIVASEAKKEMAIQYFKDCNFKNVVRVDFEI